MSSQCPRLPLDRGHGEAMRDHASLGSVMGDTSVFISCFTLDGLWAMHT